MGLIAPVLSGGGGSGTGIGALVGQNKGTIIASYVRGGSISPSRNDAVVGGLVGQNGVSATERGTIRASYATAAVSNGNRDYTQTGGLVGNNQHGTITASYAAGTVSGSGQFALFGCLVGRNAFWQPAYSRRHYQQLLG